MKQPWRSGCYGDMKSEADKLRAELKRYTKLRAWSSDKKARETLSEFIKVTEERLRQLEDAAARSDPR
jgi:hypothetical protein